ncbi:hypothetical protein [Cupriavidus campinensis]|uniref:Uncharacterized protein n=1 Tax=Cupriavidus campinensis TaxID=151783 RepID=A0ABY3ESR5_9BURK|nr:hypothetical protein [Cupriavidus campinensis]TSP14009.1 hypothetical protein FGG12_05930 [Cupriavidus campinensis]
MATIRKALMRWWESAKVWQRLLAGCIANLWLFGILMSMDGPEGLRVAAVLSALVLGIASACSGCSE